MSSNSLTKAAAARRRAANPYSLGSALTNGGPWVWASCLLMGLGNFVAGQIIKGLLFLAIEVVVIWYLFNTGVYWLQMFPTLGWLEETEVWSDELGYFVYQAGHNSQQILLYSVATMAIIVAFIVIWRASVRSGYEALCIKRSGKRVPKFWDDIKALFDKNVHKLLMTVPFLSLVIFTIIPLVYMMMMAFTNYSKVGGHLILFDWVGFENFKSIFSGGSAISEQFWSVLGWTLIWAFFATFLNFFFGTFVAMIINRPTTKLKGLWRTVLSFTIAVPQFVSLLIIRTMLQEQGIVNSTLITNGFITEGNELPFWSDTTWARVTIIIVNLWVGIPYTVMQVTGILKNIPADLYEAARIDGANVVQQFINITLPYMIFVLTPHIITSFTGNINNFNIIYLLSGGGPVKRLDYTAGSTDLLVTWLYKLTIDNLQYNLAAVIGILTFIILAIVSLVTYRSSGSYKDEEGFK